MWPGHARVLEERGAGFFQCLENAQMLQVVEVARGERKSQAKVVEMDEHSSLVFRFVPVRRQIALLPVLEEMR